MKNLNRLVRKSDLKWAGEVRDENKWIEKYPHATDHGNHWVKDDALLKWVFALVNYGIGIKGQKVIDLGVQNSCVPAVVADWGNDTIALDIKKAPWDQPKSSAKLVIADAFGLLPWLADESVDTFFDICAVHCFDPSHDENCGNYGLLRIAELVYQKLKPGGKFIVTSDVGDVTEGSYITAETFIEIVERTGLKLTSEFDGIVDGDTFYNGHVPGSGNLKVASLEFIK